MIKIVNSLEQVKFSELMCVYSEAIRENGETFYPKFSVSEQIYEAEQDFYRYLKSGFFCQKDSVYCIWEDDNGYCSALRLEPYKDGILLCGLETMPEKRRKGYAEKLVRGVQQYLCNRGSGILYTHVSKKNHASVMLLQKCGFQKVLDFAVYSDGSVMNNAYTFSHKYRKSEDSV